MENDLKKKLMSCHGKRQSMKKMVERENVYKVREVVGCRPIN